MYPLIKSYLATKYLRNFRDRNSLEKWQEKQVQKMLAHVIPHSPFYRERVDPEHWKETPLTEKKEMMEHFDSLNTVGIKKEEAFEIALKSEASRDFSPMIGEVAVGLSSGTSGNRGLFLVSPKERLAWAGAMLAKVLPKSLLKPQKVALVLRANNNLYDTLNSKRIQFRYFDLMDPIEEITSGLKDYQPDVLAAPPSVLLMLEEVIPSKVIAIAEVLDPLDAKKLQDKYGQKIHQIYQCTEGFLGSTCKEGTLHLNEDLVVIQKEYIEGYERKFIPIITDFSRTTQPIIRYRLNDILTESATPCPCGSPMTALERIEGRCDDIFYFPNSKNEQLVPIVPDYISRAVISSSDAIEEYQVIQHSPSSITISYRGPSSIQKDIQLAFSILCKKKGCKEPEILYNNKFRTSKGKKMKRILSEIEI